MKTKRKTKILSLILAITVVATMIMAVPFTASAAEGDVYTEWVANADKFTSTTLSMSTPVPNTLTKAPTLTADKDGKGNAPGYKDVTGLSSIDGINGSISISGNIRGVKMETATKITLNTNFSENTKNSEFASYSLKIIVSSADQTEGYVKIAGTGSSSDKDFDEQTEAFTGSQQLKTFEKKDLDCETITITQGSKQVAPIYIGIKYKVPSTEKILNIPEETYNVPTGEEITIIPETENLTGDITWKSDNESITVNEGVVKGDQPGQATITAESVTDNIKDTCTVIVSDSKTVNVSFGLGIGSAKIQKQPDGQPQELIKGEQKLDYGTYKITYELSAPMTYVADNIPEELTVGAYLPITSRLELNTKNHEISEVSFGPEVYNAMYGKTIIWGCDSNTWYPKSMHEINSLQQNNIVPIAGAVQGNTEDSDVYMTVQGGKIHAARDGSFQINQDTVLSIPVVENSTITVKNDASKKATYTLGNETGINIDNKTYKATAEDAQKGYVQLKVTAKDGYLQYITVETPDSPITWGDHETDSGYYEDNGKKGVIRFLQGYTGTATGYGFYIVDKDGKIIESNKIEGNKDLSDAEGIYADLIDIEENNPDSYYMKAYVVVNGAEIWGPAFGGKVNWDRPVEKPTE